MAMSSHSQGACYGSQRQCQKTIEVFSGQELKGDGVCVAARHGRIIRERFGSLRDGTGGIGQNRFAGAGQPETFLRNFGRAICSANARRCATFAKEFLTPGNEQREAVLEKTPARED